MSVIQLFTSSSYTDFKSALDRHLDGISLEAELNQLIQVFYRSRDIDESLSELVNSPWNRSVDRQLWTVRYSSLSFLQQAIGFQHTIKPFIDLDQAYNARAITESAAVYSRWKRLPKMLSRSLWRRPESRKD
jgi:hypothetical protein